jgi:hypothetical protein
MALQHRFITFVAILFLASFPSLAAAKYNPEVGRFMQRDPIGYVNGSSLYQYVQSNPLIYLDPSGLKLVVEGGARTRERVEGALQQLCPSATVNDDGSVTVPDFDPDGCDKKDFDGSDCGESPGCDMLRDLDSSPTRYPVQSGNKGGFKWGWNTPHGPVFYVIRVNTDKTEDIYRINDDGDRVYDREGEPWEVLWHELTHAHRHSKGEHPFDETSKRNPGSDALKKEEVDAINKMNELRDWWQQCGGGQNGQPNNIGPRDPNGH